MALEYITGSALKDTLGMAGETYADADINDACEAASRVVDGFKNVPPGGFLPGTADVDRYYTADPYLDHIPINDLLVAGTVAIDTAGDGTYTEVWEEGTDFYLDPPNASLDGHPSRRLVLRHQAGRRFPTYQRGVRITGRFGWAATPAQVKVATKILATRYAKRPRETPYGVAAVGEAAVSLRRTDPDVANLLDSIQGATNPLFV